MACNQSQKVERSKEKFDSLLQDVEDVFDVLSKLVSAGVVSADLRDKINRLDLEHLRQDVIERYLLQKVCERVKEDEQAYFGLLNIPGYSGSLTKGEDPEECDDVRNSNAEIRLKEKARLKEEDIPHLVEFLACVNYKWENIGIALGFPKHVLAEYDQGNNTTKLRDLLTTWIIEGHENSKEATLDNLRAALASQTVGSPTLAGSLKNGIPKHGRSPKMLCLKKKVSEGKSILLEVLVDSTGGGSYQWSKDGAPLSEGMDYSDVSSSMLYINKAGERTKGKYSCRIKSNKGPIQTKGFHVIVLYPLEKKELLDFYRNFQNKEMECTPTFVNLLLINQKNRKGCDYTIRGDVDDILEGKEVVEYEKIFQESRDELVLIEGRPGSGKTTLFRKVSLDWMQEKNILQGVKYLFLITLRHLNKSSSLSDIMEMFYESEKMRESVEQDLKESAGEGACFLMDGLDEYQNVSTEKSIIYQIIDRNVLPSSMVFVASRPAATGFLRRKGTKRIEVVGFTKAQINKYVESYPFKTSDDDTSSKMASDLKKFLDLHPNVQHLCYLPVHAAMICFLFDVNEGEIPNTETAIYEEFTLSTIARHKERHSKEEFEVDSLSELDDEDKSLFKSICKLAFDMTTKSQQVVSKAEARKSLSTTEGAFFGLLTVDRSPKRLYANHHVYMFHHLTFQEYLAAHHIAGLSEVEQVSIVSEYKWIKEGDVLQNTKKFYCGIMQYEKCLELQNDKTFLSNLLGSQNCLSSYGIQCAFESQCEEFYNYVIPSSKLKLEGNQHITQSDFSALGHTLSNSSSCVSKLSIHSNCFWDKNAVKIFSLLDCNNKLESITHLECIGGASSTEGCEAWNGLLSVLPSLEEVDLRDWSLNKYKIELLTQQGVTLQYLKALRISVPELHCSHPETVMNLLRFGRNDIKIYFYGSSSSNSGLDLEEFPFLKKISAFRAKARRDCDTPWLHLYNSDSVPERSFRCCTDIVLVNCNIDDAAARTLVSSLSPSILEKIVLDFNSVSDNGAKALAEILSCGNLLREFSLQCNSVGNMGAIALANAAAKVSTLTKLDLQGNNIDDEGALHITKTLQSSLYLDLYLHSVKVTQEGISRVLECRATTHIKTMVFGSSWKSICDEGVEALRKGSKCECMPALEITSTNVMEVTRTLEVQKMNIKSLTVDTSSSNMDAIITLLQHLEHLQQLNLHVQGLDSKACRDVCSSLGSLKGLRSLSVRYFKTLFSSVPFNNLVDSVGIQFGWGNLHTVRFSDSSLSSSKEVRLLCKLLGYCKYLSCLDLSRNRIDDDGAEALAEALKEHTALKELDLSCNEITSEGISAWPLVITNNKIQHLDISCNHIRGSCNSLAEAIVKRGDSLRSLHLNENKLDMKCITEGLKSLTQLSVLNLPHLNISLQAAAILAENIRSCSQLNHLNIAGNGITSMQVVASLAKSLEHCKNLIEVDLSENGIDSQGIALLATGFMKCSWLKILNLSNNEITSDGLDALASILNNCRFLQHLGLEDNQIGIDGAARLVKEWKRKAVLTIKLFGSINSSHFPALYDEEWHCKGCNRLLQLYQSKDNVIIKLKRSIPKFVQ